MTESGVGVRAKLDLAYRGCGVVRAKFVVGLEDTASVIPALVLPAQRHYPFGDDA